MICQKSPYVDLIENEGLIENEAKKNSRSDKTLTTRNKKIFGHNSITLPLTSMGGYFNDLSQSEAVEVEIRIWSSSASDNWMTIKLHPSPVCVCVWHVLLFAHTNTAQCINKTFAVRNFSIFWIKKNHVRVVYEMIQSPTCLMLILLLFFFCVQIKIWIIE